MSAVAQRLMPSVTSPDASIPLGSSARGAGPGQKPPRTLRPYSAFVTASELQRSLQPPRGPGPRPLVPSLVQVDLEEERRARWEGGRVAVRTFTPRRVMPPYTGAAWSSALLLQSAYRGHLRRVFVLVELRLQPATALPVRVASLAYNMISLPTTFQLFKRLVVYYAKHQRPIAIPDDFSWEGILDPDVAQAMATRIQGACRGRIARRKRTARARDKHTAAQIPNIISKAIADMADDAEASLLATKSEQPERAHGVMELSAGMVLSEEEGNAVGQLIGHTPQLETLLFLASRDGWSSAAFNAACAGRRKLLVLCSSSSEQHGGDGGDATHVFGAYTSIAWAKHGGFKSDPEACLLSVRSGTRRRRRAGGGAAAAAAAAAQSSGGSALRSKYECEPLRCDCKKGRGCAVLHYSALHQMDSRFFGGGPLFGRGPDLYVDLDNRGNSLCEVGQTYGLPPPPLTPEDASPWWLAGSSPFFALEVAVFCFDNEAAAAKPQAAEDPEEERRSTRAQRIEAIGEWLEGQEEASAAVLAQPNTAALQVSAALTLSVEHLQSLAHWGHFPDVRMSRLLYLASRDGFSNEAFHAKVDGVSPATLLLVRTATRFVFGAFATVPWNSTKSQPNPATRKIERVPDLKGTWVSDPNAFLFRLEPGPPVQLPQIAYPEAAIRHRHGTGPAFGDRAADLSLDLDQPSRSRSMLGGGYLCPEGAAPRTFLAGSFSGWAVLEVAVFKVQPRTGREEEAVGSA